MPFKKVEEPAEIAAVGALLQLLPGKSERDLLDRLQQEGAESVCNLAPGFYSVVATPRALGTVETLARVEIKRRKSPLAG